jgi:hypothetical protein
MPRGGQATTTSPTARGSGLKRTFESTRSPSAAGAAPATRSQRIRDRRARKAAGIADRAKTDKHAALRRSNASAQTKATYLKAVNDFTAWARPRHLVLQHPDLVRHMELYSVQLASTGLGPAAGRNLLYGWLFFKSENYEKDLLELSNMKRTINGWSKEVMEEERDPAPLEVLWWMGVWFPFNGMLSVALCLVLQLDGYMRPTEALELTEDQIIKPAPLAGAQYATSYSAHLAPQTRGKRSKAGQVDDSFVFGTKGRMWVVNVVKGLARRTRKGAHLFPGTLASYERAFQKASRALKIEALGITPHVVRHTGPSNDRLFNLRPLSEVMKRGRWGHIKSCTRYEKRAKIMRQLGLMTKQQQVSMKTAAAQFPQMLLFKLAKGG